MLCPRLHTSLESQGKTPSPQKLGALRMQPKTLPGSMRAVQLVWSLCPTFQNPLQYWLRGNKSGRDDWKRWRKELCPRGSFLKPDSHLPPWSMQATQFWACSGKICPSPCTKTPASEFCMQGDIAELGEGAMAKADVVTTSRRCYQSPLEVLKGVRFKNHK